MPSSQSPSPSSTSRLPPQRGGAATVGAWVLLAVACGAARATAAEPADGPPIPDASAAPRLIGYTELQTNLPGGRHANVRTMRATVIATDGSGRRTIGDELTDGPDAWTQFGGWSPDGRQAFVGRGWQDQGNARWEEEHREFRMVPGAWLVDVCLVGLEDGAAAVNLTAVERVSHFNSNAFFMPDGRRLGFTALIDGVSRPFVMDLDGRSKRDLSGAAAGFAYGYSASPDGRKISYHENYQLSVADADGSNKRHIETGRPFNFGPRWSPDGEWLLFVSGEHDDCHPHVVRADGSGLRKLADRGGYRGAVEFLDVFDFHGGSSDVPAWSADGREVFYTARVDETVELFRVALTGEVMRLTRTAAGSWHYHPTPSPDGKWLAFGAKRDGVRNLYLLDLERGREIQLTRVPPGRAAMWPFWQPRPTPLSAVRSHDD